MKLKLNKAFLFVGFFILFYFFIFLVVPNNSFASLICPTQGPPPYYIWNNDPIVCTGTCTDSCQETEASCLEWKRSERDATPQCTCNDNITYYLCSDESCCTFCANHGGGSCGGAVCGDGFCTGSEDATSCPADCSDGGGGSCTNDPIGANVNGPTNLTLYQGDSGTASFVVYSNDYFQGWTATYASCPVGATCTPSTSSGEAYEGPSGDEPSYSGFTIAPSVSTPPGDYTFYINVNSVSQPSCGDSLIYTITVKPSRKTVCNDTWYEVSSALQASQNPVGKYYPTDNFYYSDHIAVVAPPSSNQSKLYEQICYYASGSTETCSWSLQWNDQGPGSLGTITSSPFLDLVNNKKAYWVNTGSVWNRHQTSNGWISPPASPSPVWNSPSQTTEKNNYSYTFRKNGSNVVEYKCALVPPPPTIPATPTGLSAAPSTCGNNWLNISWNAVSGATSYQVYRDGGGTPVYNGSGLSFSDTGLALGSTHSYTVRATNTSGSSPLSASVSGTVASACGALSVSITSPAEGSNYTDTSNMPLSWTTGGSNTCLMWFSNGVGGSDIGPRMPYTYCPAGANTTQLSYVQMPTISGVSATRLAAYDFAENTGITTYDRSGNSNTGNLINTPTWTAGRFGRALSLNGSSQYINLGNNASLKPSGAFSVAAWINANASQVAYPQIVSSVSSESGGVYGWNFFLQNGAGLGRASLIVRETGYGWADCYALGTTDLRGAGWKFVVGVYDGATAKVYVDNVLQHTDACRSQAVDYGISSRAEIGRKYSAEANTYFAGTIDEVAVYNRALTATEVANMYANSAFNGPHTLNVSATNGVSTVSDANSFTIGPVATADLKVNDSDNPPAINSGQTATVKWCGTTPSLCANATSCSVTCTGGCSGWTGTSDTRSEALTASRTYTLTCDPGGTTDSISLTVNANQFQLTVIKSGQGTVVSSPAGINCGSGCASQSANFTENSTVTLTPTAAPGRVFTGWSGACTGTGICSIVMNGAKSVTANFALNPSFIEF
ncbi:MAG: LamG-like jellyroll fold domain-containing protein [Patescibacteria group bacterium]